LFFPCPPIQSVSFGAKPTKPIVPQNKVRWDPCYPTQLSRSPSYLVRGGQDEVVAPHGKLQPLSHIQLC
jgi:hypothetical protein